MADIWDVVSLSSSDDAGGGSGAGGGGFGVSSSSRRGARGTVRGGGGGGGASKWLKSWSNNTGSAPGPKAETGSAIPTGRSRFSQERAAARASRNQTNSSGAGAGVRKSRDFFMKPADEVEVENEASDEPSEIEDDAAAGSVALMCFSFVASLSSFVCGDVVILCWGEERSSISEDHLRAMQPTFTN